MNENYDVNNKNIIRYDTFSYQKQNSSNVTKNNYFYFKI